MIPSVSIRIHRWLWRADHPRYRTLYAYSLSLLGHHAVIGNMLVVGRAIGDDKIAHAATRNMACCAVVGQGAAVALSIKQNCPLDQLDLAPVQAELEAQNVRLH